MLPCGKCKKDIDRLNLNNDMARKLIQQPISSWDTRYTNDNIIFKNSKQNPIRIYKRNKGDVFNA